MMNSIIYISTILSIIITFLISYRYSEQTQLLLSVIKDDINQNIQQTEIKTIHFGRLIVLFLSSFLIFRGIVYLYTSYNYYYKLSKTSFIQKQNNLEDVTKTIYG